MLHQWFTCVHLLDTYLANLTEDFQLSFTTHQFPSEQHKVVCNQHLHAECSGSATISLEVRQKSIKYSQYLTSFCLRTHIPFAKARKRIETIFSQLTDQFLVIRNYAKITNGLFARIIGKISALTILQYVNFINDKPIGRIKYALN